MRELREAERVLRERRWHPKASEQTYSTYLDINQPGDSGAPVYTPSGATGAIINGMNLGANTCCSETLFHRVSTIESTLGVITMTP